MTQRKIPADVQLIVDGLESQNDRSVALVGVALVEHFLERAIESNLRLPATKSEREFLFNARGPGSSFENKIYLGYTLKVTAEKTTRDLHLMRAIRNEFAHDMNEIAFASPHISNRIDEFHAVTVLWKISKATGASPRERFLKEIYTLVSGFQLTLEGLTENAITTRE